MNQILFPYDEFLNLFYWDKHQFRPCGLLNCGNRLVFHLFLTIIPFMNCFQVSITCELDYNLSVVGVVKINSFLFSAVALPMWFYSVCPSPDHFLPSFTRKGTETNVISVWAFSFSPPYLGLRPYMLMI